MLLCQLLLLDAYILFLIYDRFISFHTCKTDLFLASPPLNSFPIRGTRYQSMLQFFLYQKTEKLQAFSQWKRREQGNEWKEWNANGSKNMRGEN